MWIFANFGAVFPALRPPESVAPGDDRIYQIRARRREHLDRLRTHYMHDLGPTYEIPDTDYEYRADVSLIGMVTGFSRVLADIDYQSMKPTTVERWNDKGLHDAYVRVWGTTNAALAPPAHTTQYPHTYQPGAGRARYLRRRDVKGKRRNPTAPVEVEPDWSHLEEWAGLGDDDHNLLTWMNSEPDITVDDALEGARARREKSLMELLAEAQTGVVGPVLKGDRLSHAQCAHADSKNARARCRRRFLGKKK